MKKVLLLINLSMIMMLTLLQTSFAQINWMKSVNSPILSPGGTWTSHGFPFIYLIETDDTLRMWFTGADGDPVGSDRIGYAISTDGISFTFEDFPVLEPSGGNNFDSEGVFGAAVLYDGEIYRMWYNGYDTQPYYAGMMEVGLATSQDGMNWTRYSTDPVLQVGEPGSWDDVWAYVNTVLYEDEIYKMWYTGFNGSQARIGYATSEDGTNWTKYPGNPVISPLGSGQGDLDAAQNARVIHNENAYEMWFNGQYSNPDFNIYYGYSDNGIDWEYSKEPVLTTGADLSFDADWVWSPCVLYEDGLYRMWYSGYNGNEWSVGYATDSTRVGVSEPDRSATIIGDISVYPNPATTYVRITCKISEQAPVSITLADGLGREFYRITDLPRSIGEHTTILDLHDLQPGMYFCLLECGSVSQASKIVVRR